MLKTSLQRRLRAVTLPGVEGENEVQGATGLFVLAQINAAADPSLAPRPGRCQGRGSPICFPAASPAPWER
uniref:Uncharacterized protein n=1 Tax=Oryza rufipogon TaxID=4529 RepID=A0A0E0N8H9_ORYRU